MAEVTRKRSGELVRGVFSLLLAKPDGLPAKDVLSRLDRVAPPTDSERQPYPSTPGVRRYERIVRFSTIPFVKAGWLLKDKGQWSLTEDGRQAYEHYRDPSRFVQEAHQLYKKWVAAQPKNEPVNQDGETEDLETAGATIEEAEERAWAEIEQHLADMSPYDFQHLVAGLIRGMGYHVAWVSPPGRDGGIDVIAHTDPLGVTGPRIKVQVKRRPGERTGVDGVRAFMAVLADGDIGLFVSSGGFSKDAEEEARRQEKRRIVLVDLKRLFDLWVEYYTRIPEEQRRLFPLRAIYFLANDE